MTSLCLPDSPEEKELLRLHHAEVRERLTKAILMLPEQELLVFTLRYYERLTTEEMRAHAPFISISNTHRHAFLSTKSGLRQLQQQKPLIPAAS
jgi:DNA-directed RNA polymerase specialized sigma subunit